MFERDHRAGGHAHTVVHDGPRARHRVPRPQRAELPAARAPLRRARRRDAARRRCRSRSAATAAGSSTRAGGRSRSRGTPPAPRFIGLLWEIGRWLRTARRSLDEADYERHSLGAYLDERRLLAAFPAPLPRAADLGALVDGARARARVSRRLRDPLLRQPRHARLRPLPLADRQPAAAARYVDALARAARRRVCGSAWASARCGATSTASS